MVNKFLVDRKVDIQYTQPILSDIMLIEASEVIEKNT
jgi:hypothetical protein